MTELNMNLNLSGKKLRTNNDTFSSVISFFISIFRQFVQKAQKINPDSMDVLANLIALTYLYPRSVACACLCMCLCENEGERV